LGFRYIVRQASNIKISSELLIPFLMTVVVYSICLILSSAYGYDTATRSLMGWRWLNKPFHIFGPNEVTWVFAPLNCYLNGAITFILKDPNLGPRLLSTAFGILTVIPLIGITRMVFGCRSAVYAAYIFPFYSLYVGLAVSSNCESLSSFLILSSFYFLLNYFENRTLRHLIFCGIFLNLATATRYDLWMFLAVMPMAILIMIAVRREWRLIFHFLAFIFIAFSFGIYWIIGNYVTTGDSLNFVNQVRNLNDNYIRANNIGSGHRQILYSLAFFPAVKAIALSPITFGFAIVGSYFAFKRKQRGALLFNFLFITLILYFLYTFVISRQIIIVSRFLVLHGLFMIIYAGFAFHIFEIKYSKWKSLIPAAIVVLMSLNITAISYCSNVDNEYCQRLRPLSPVVREPRHFEETAQYLENEISSGKTVFIDAGHYDQRALYLKLFKARDQIQAYWGKPDKIANILSTGNFDLIVFSPTNPRTKKMQLAKIDNFSMSQSEYGYRLKKQFGGFMIFELEYYTLLELL